MKAKAVEEEKALFFNQPRAVADISYWGKMALWTLDEAIALSLGKNPSVVNWSAVNGDSDSYILAALQNSPFRREYVRRRQLTSRAAAAHELSDPIKPEAFVAWSLNVFDSVPAELIEQVRAMGKRIADLHVLTKRVVELEAQLSAYGKAAPASDLDKPLDTRERTTLLRIIRALDVMASLPNRGAASSVQKQLEEIGFTSGPGNTTIRKTLEQARALDPDSKSQ
jgi:hypothetical protein